MNVLVLSGHTGGHLFPCIGFSENLKLSFPQSRITLITSEKARPFLQGKFTDLFETTHFLPSFPSPSGISLSWFLFTKKLFDAFSRTSRILNQMKPDVCIGFGSYVSYPGIVLAHRRKIPTLIHEQNARPGRATSWLVPHADIIATSFPDTFPNIPASKVFHVGLPLKTHILQTGGWRSKVMTTDPHCLRLLVMGGSQGAHWINKTVVQALSELSDEEKDKLVVNHIAGKQDWNEVRCAYEKVKIRAQVFSFFDRMDEIFLNTDFAISRAGANTLFELSYFGIPALLIPYPYAGGHQLLNARFFENRSAAWCAQERDLVPGLVLEKIRLLMRSFSALEPMADKMRSLAMPDAGCGLVKLARQLAGFKYDQ